MSTQLIDLESGSVATGDSGERTDADAIKPIDAGERVQAAVIDRPFENLRARTEELRQKVEELLYRADADKWIITGGNTIGQVTVPGAAAFPTVSWNATTGLCTVSEAIVVQPFVAPSTDLFGFIDWAFTESVAPFGTVTFQFKANDDPLAGTILYDYQLANSLRVYWESSASLGAGVFCQATLEGSPVHMLRIVVRSDGTTNAGHVEDALNLILAPVVPDSILKFSLTGLGTTFVEWVETPGRPNEYMFNTYSREMHRMTKTVFDGFFVGSPLSVDGDGIGIWYEELTDSDTTQHGGRRQATPTTIEDISGLAPNTIVPVTKLFKFSTEPEKIPGCIPLCRRIGTYLVFIDGTVVEHGQTAQFGLDNAADIYSAAIVDSPSSLAAGTVHAQMIEALGHINDRVVLTDLAQDTGASDGTTLVGAEAITGTPTSTTRGTQKNTNTELLAGVNARPRMANPVDISGAWTFTGRAAFESEFWAKSGCIGVHDPGKSLTQCLAGVLGNVSTTGWGFSDAVDNYSSPSATTQFVDICGISDPVSATSAFGNKGLIIAYLTSAGTVYFRPGSFSASSIAAITLPGATVYSAMCSDGSGLYILGKSGTVCTVYHYSYDVGTGVFTQTWSRVLNQANCFGDYPTNRVKYMTPGYIVILCGNVTCDTEGVIVSLRSSDGAFNATWNATAFGEAKGTGATDAARKPTGGLVCTTNDTNSSKQIVAYSVGALSGAGAVDGSIHFAKISDGSAPSLTGYDAPLDTSYQDRAGAVLDIAYDGHALWYSAGTGSLRSFDSTLMAELTDIKVLPYNQAGTLPVRFAAGYAGGLATDGFSIFAASAHATDGGTLLSKYPTHGDSHAWYSSEWATHSFPRAERVVAQLESGDYTDAANCGRVFCDGTHVWIIATIKSTGVFYKSRLIRVPLYSIID